MAPRPKPSTLKVHDEEGEPAPAFEALKATGKSRPKAAELPPTPMFIPVNRVVDSPFQTREEPSAESIEELAQSLAKDGLRQPIRVREIQGGKYELLGGHRRIRAAMFLKWDTITGVIITADDAAAAYDVFADNQNRSDLNVIERVRGLQVIWEQYQAAGKSMDQMAVDVGMDQSTISNSLRLLAAPDSLQTLLISGEITAYQLRVIARWLKYDGFIEKFEKSLKMLEAGDRISNADWFSGVREAIEDISRPAKRQHAHWAAANDPAFNVEKHAEELEIVEVSLPGIPKFERCMKKQRWDELQKEGKKKQKELDKKKQDRAKATADKPETKRTNRDAWEFRDKMKDAWFHPLWEKIGVAISGKLTKPEQAVAARLILMCDRGVDDDWIAESLKATDSQYVEECLAIVKANWKDAMPWNLSGKDLLAIASHFGVEIASKWKPTKELLDACELADLVDMAADLLGLPGAVDMKRDELIKRLLANWTPGWIPDLLSIEPPKPKAKAAPKKKAAK